MLSPILFVLFFVVTQFAITLAQSNTSLVIFLSITSRESSHETPNNKEFLNHAITDSNNMHHFERSGSSIKNTFKNGSLYPLNSKYSNLSSRKKTKRHIVKKQLSLDDRWQSRSSLFFDRLDVDDPCSVYSLEDDEEPHTMQQKIEDFKENLDLDLSRLRKDEAESIESPSNFNKVINDITKEDKKKSEEEEMKESSSDVTKKTEERLFGPLFYGLNHVFADTYKYFEAINRNFGAIQIFPKKTLSRDEHEEKMDEKTAKEIRILTKAIDRNYEHYYRCHQLLDDGRPAKNNFPVAKMAAFQEQQFQTLFYAAADIKETITEIQIRLASKSKESDEHFKAVIKNIVKNENAIIATQRLANESLARMNLLVDIMNQHRHETAHNMAQMFDFIKNGNFERAVNFQFVQIIMHESKAEVEYSALEKSINNITQDVFKKMIRTSQSNVARQSLQLIDSKAVDSKDNIHLDDFSKKVIDLVANETIRHEIQRKNDLYNYYTETKNLFAVMQNETLFAVNQIRVDLKEGVKTILDGQNRSTDIILKEQYKRKLKEVLSELKTFADNLVIQINRLKQTRNIVQKLEEPNGILHHIEKHLNPSEPNYFHFLLLNIINQRFAIPKNAHDEMAYHIIESLYRGTRLCYSLMNIVLDCYYVIANSHYENDNLSEFNRYIDLYFEKFYSYKMYFNWGNSDGLINKVINTLKEVLNSTFLLTQRENIFKGVTQKLIRLNKLKQRSLKEKTTFVRSNNQPKINNRPDFYASNVTTPIGKWVYGKKVAYALQYVYEDGVAEIGDWSRYYTITEKANPLLTLPTIFNTEKVIKRLIFRKFFDNEKPELVGIIEDKSQTKFRDIHKDLYNSASEETNSNEAGIFLLNGADVNFKFKKRKSILHAAAENDNVETARILLRHGANINARDDKGQTPLLLAAEAGNKRFITFAIENNADINAKTIEGLTALIIASLNSQIDIVRYLLSNNNTDINVRFLLNFTAFHIASISHSASSVLRLFVENARTDINAKTIGGFTPLHLAVASNNKEAVSTFMPKLRGSIVEQSDKGLTPLHIASLVGNENIMQILLSNVGSDVNVKAVGDLSPLHLAAATGNLQALKLLNSHTNINPNARTNDLMTPLHLALALRQEAAATEIVKHNKTQMHTKEKHGMLPVHFAIINGENNVLVHLLMDSKDINEKTENNLTLLHFAAMYNNPGAASILLNKGADIKAKATGDLTALHISSIYGSTEVAKLLMNVTVLINMTAANNLTALHFAAVSNSMGISALLLEKNADVNAKDSNEQTPVYIALKYNNKDLANVLMEKGADVNLLLSNRKTFLHLAAEKGDDYVIKHLIMHGLIKKKDSLGQSALHYAALHGKLNACRLLLDNGADIFAKNVDGDMPIHLAAGFGKSDAARVLIEYDLSTLNARGKLNYTPLYCSVLQNHSETTRLLLNKGAKVYDTGNYSNDPAGTVPSVSTLHMAAYLGLTNMLKILLEYNPDVFAKDKYGNMPIHLAAKYGKTDAVQILIEYDLNTLNVRDRFNYTPLHYAVWQNHSETTRLLLNKGANVNDTENYRNDPTGTAPSYSVLHMAAVNGLTNILKILLEYNPDVFAKDKYGNMPIHLAAKYGKTHAVQILIEYNQNTLNVRGGTNYTPLHYAVWQNHSETTRLLLEKGANVNDTANYNNDPAGTTPSYSVLHIAARHGLTNILKILLEYNPDVFAKNKDGLMPIHLAAKYGKTDAIQLLVNFNKSLINVRSTSNSTPLDLATDNNTKQFLITQGGI